MNCAESLTTGLVEIQKVTNKPEKSSIMDNVEYDGEKAVRFCYHLDPVITMTVFGYLILIISIDFFNFISVFPLVLHIKNRVHVSNSFSTIYCIV